MSSRIVYMDNGTLTINREVRQLTLCKHCWRCAKAEERGLGGHTSKKQLYFKKKTGEVVYLQSSYEIRFAEILEELDIAWERPSPFIWVDKDGISHRYYPDFKIGSVYVDTKNDYLAVKDLDKITRVKDQNQIDLRIVTEKFINAEYIAELAQR